MKITALTICFFSCLLQTRAQCPNLVQSATQNLQWFDSLSRQPMQQQINMIAERLAADTCVLLPKNRPLLSKADLRKYIVEDSIQNIGKVKGWQAPLIMINNQPLNQSTSPATTQIKQWYQQLRQDRFKKISVLLPTPQTAALYGTKGAIGVVLMEDE